MRLVLGWYCLLLLGWLDGTVLGHSVDVMFAEFVLLTHPCPCARVPVRARVCVRTGSLRSSSGGKVMLPTYVISLKTLNGAGVEDTVQFTCVGIGIPRALVYACFGLSVNTGVSYLGVWSSVYLGATESN